MQEEEVFKEQKSGRIWIQSLRCSLIGVGLVSVTTHVKTREGLDYIQRTE